MINLDEIWKLELHTLKITLFNLTRHTNSHMHEVYPQRLKTRQEFAKKFRVLKNLLAIRVINLDVPNISLQNLDQTLGLVLNEISLKSFHIGLITRSKHKHDGKGEK